MMRIRKKYLFYTIAFTSAFFAALTTSIDSYVNKNYIPDPYAFSFSLFFIGLFVTFIVSLALSIQHRGKSIGSKLIDPSFKHLRFLNKNELKYHIIAGLTNAVNTIAYCALISIVLEPSVLLSFSQMVILYLLLIESITEKNVPTLAEIQSSVIVTFGAILASISLKGEIEPVSLALVFLVINPTWAIFSIYQRKLKMMKIHNKPNDGINIRFWNVLFSLLFTGMILAILDIITGSEYIINGLKASIEHYSYLGLTMFTTFFAYVLYIRSLGLGKASINNAIRASTIIFAIPFSIILYTYFNIPLFSTDPVMLTIKTIGMILIVLGIISFALTQVKAYIFITLKPGFTRKDIMKRLWDIPGVSHVTATAGTYDFIVKVSTRTLVKGYERILRRIDDIEAIESYKWNSVLKDWERI
ncbi:MAG: Lrp/AsnC ligand binding domain-containing protein [Candidatus Thermoplasmatota archaeon]